MPGVHLKYRPDQHPRLVYSRVASMHSQSSEGRLLTGEIEARQIWTLERPLGEVCELSLQDQVITRKGPLQRYFPEFSEARRLFLDSCGFLPAPGQDYPVFSAFPSLLEEPVQAGDAWSVAEWLPNWDGPQEIHYGVVSLGSPRAGLATLQCTCQAESPGGSLSLEGTFEFDIQQGRLEFSRLQLIYRRLRGAPVEIELLTELQADDPNGNFC